MLVHKNITKFNKLWQKGTIKAPLTILIGGAAGTGKSTLQQIVAKYIPHATLISTSTIRAILRTRISQQELPELYELTYKLWHNTSSQDKILTAYKKQCQPIIDSTVKLAEFAQIEMQHHYIEGSHFIPGTIKGLEIPIFEIFLKVSSPTEHRKRLSGPTHQRTISSQDFQTARLIHDFIVTECNKYNALIIESDTHLTNIFLDKLDSYLAHNIFPHL